MPHLPSERYKRRGPCGKAKVPAMVKRLDLVVAGGHDTISSALYGIHGFSWNQLRAGERCQFQGLRPVYVLYNLCQSDCFDLYISYSQNMPEHIYSSIYW